MKLVSVKCPECGATAQPPEGADRVRCDYCGTTSVVRRRTRFLEVPIAPRQTPQHANMPVATQVHSTRWTVLSVAIPLAMVGAVSAIGFAVQKGATSPSQRYGWWSSGIILTDVTGDGVPDPIGKIFFAVQDSVHVAAFDGASGDRVWMTDKLGDSSDHSLLLTHAGDTVVLASSIGQLYGHSTATGERTWSASLPEAPSRPCGAGSDAAVVIVTADDAHHRVALADGAITTEPAPDEKRPCPPVETDLRDTAGPDIERADSDAWDPRKPSSVGGVYVSYHLFPAGDDVTFAFGTRKEGSSVPMIAAFRTQLPEDTDAREGTYTVLWETKVPANNPLTAYTSAPVRATLDRDAVYVVYDMKKGPHRLASFARADGARRWDVPLPDEDLDWIHALRATGDLVYLSDSMRLEVFSAADGRHVRTVADGTYR